MIVRYNNLVGCVPTGLTQGSHHLILWTCDCGRQVTRPFREVHKGRSKSCGKCNWLTVEFTKSNKFNNLKMKSPMEIAPCSNKKIVWVCDCGRETIATMQTVYKEKIKSCGKCNEISAKKMAKRKFHKLKIKSPRAIMPGSHQKIIWVCDCGREKAIDISSVVKGLSKSCGDCSTILAKEMSTRKFGRLKLKNPTDIKPGSAKKRIWVCDCGNETKVMTAHVIGGHTKSCGKCLLAMKQHYENSKRDIRKLRTPITPDQLPDWCPIALEIITNVNTPFKAQCRLCGKKYKPRWYSIRLGLSLTCGCTTSRVSHGQKQLHKFITNLGVEAKTEYKINKMKYDIFVPSHNITIEYCGLKWHSFPDSKRRDIMKHRNASNNGLRHLMIFEDEWIFNKQKVKNLIRNLLGVGKSRKTRPSECVIELIGAAIADRFYDEFHYIGKSRAKVNYGVFLDQTMIACCSFKRPTRQSKHDWELVRMASDPSYRVHGIWSKIMKKFILEFEPKSVVSFSDNRLFIGQVYEKMGFQYDGEIKPDYYWWKNKRRYHKSSMRKPKQEPKTEDELRKGQGYLKIWDLGKKRWVYNSRTRLP